MIDLRGRSISQFMSEADMLTDLIEEIQYEKAAILDCYNISKDKIAEMSGDYDILKDENETLKDKIIELENKLKEAYKYQEIFLAEKAELEEECERLYEKLVSGEKICK